MLSPPRGQIHTAQIPGAEAGATGDPGTALQEAPTSSAPNEVLCTNVLRNMPPCSCAPCSVLAPLVPMTAPKSFAIGACKETMH